MALVPLAQGFSQTFNQCVSQSCHCCKAPLEEDLLASDIDSFHKGSIETLAIWQLASYRVSE